MFEIKKIEMIKVQLQVARAYERYRLLMLYFEVYKLWKRCCLVSKDILCLGNYESSNVPRPLFLGNKRMMMGQVGVQRVRLGIPRKLVAATRSDDFRRSAKQVIQLVAKQPSGISLVSFVFSFSLDHNIQQLNEFAEHIHLSPLR